MKPSAAPQPHRATRCSMAVAPGLTLLMEGAPPGVEGVLVVKGDGLAGRGVRVSGSGAFMAELRVCAAREAVVGLGAASGWVRPGASQCRQSRWQDARMSPVPALRHVCLRWRRCSSGAATGSSTRAEPPPLTMAALLDGAAPACGLAATASGGTPEAVGGRRLFVGGQFALLYTAMAHDISPGMGFARDPDAGLHAAAGGGLCG